MGTEHSANLKPEPIDRLLGDCDPEESIARERALEWLADELCRIVVDKQTEK